MGREQQSRLPKQLMQVSRRASGDSAGEFLNRVYLNNIVEHDHQAIKRITRPMLGFKSVGSARIIIAGIETMHMIYKGQLDCSGGQPVSVANQFYSFTA